MKELVVSKAKPGKARQAEYAARMRANGYKQRTLWLTSDESILIDKLLSGIRRRCGGADE